MWLFWQKYAFDNIFDPKRQQKFWQRDKTSRKKAKPKEIKYKSQALWLLRFEIVDAIEPCSSLKTGILLLHVHLMKWTGSSESLKYLELEVSHDYGIYCERQYCQLGNRQFWIYARMAVNRKWNNWITKPELLMSGWSPDSSKDFCICEDVCFPDLAALGKHKKQTTYTWW